MLRLPANRTRSRRRQRRYEFESLETRRVLDSTVVFNELMYHPADEDPRGEWIELRNLLAVDMDLSGWSLQDAVRFDFPDGTVVPGDGYLIVGAAPEAWEGHDSQVQVLGPWDGALSNGGETVELYNNSQRLMDVVEYDDHSPWPVAADGAGATLAKVDEYWTSRDEQNWHFSHQLGGTPGEPNFPPPDLTPMQTQAVSLYSSWRYDDTDRDLGDTWREPDFDDAAWPEGQALLFAGSEDAEPESGVRVVALAEDGDADISSLKVYTHTLDFGNADDGAQINGVGFTRVTTGNLTQIPGMTWANSTGVRTQNTNNELPPPSGALRELMQDYVTNTFNNANGTVTVTLEGLTAGTQYQTRIYSRRLDDDPRVGVFSFDLQGDGVPEHTLSLDQNDPTLDPPGLPDRDEPYAIEYNFQAESDELAITVQQLGFNRPWIFYGLTNEAQDQSSPTNRTELDLGPSTHYFRQSFDYAGDPLADHTMQLRLAVDDGAIVYLNGTEIHRQNMPDGPVNHGTSATQNVGSARLSEPIDVLADSLNVEGSNVLAVEVHQAADGHPDLLFGGELFVTQRPRPPQAPPQVWLNELAGPSADGFWVELINIDQAPVSLAGFVLQHLGDRDRSVVLPDVTLQPGETWQISAGPQGWSASADDRLVLFTPDQATVLDAQAVGDRLLGRRWQEGGQWRFPSAATPGSPNQFDISDAVVINEILYHGPPQYATDDLDFEESSEEWIELYNRSGEAVELAGWRLAGGIDYTFPPDTRLEPDGYLVVANDAATLQQKYPDIAIVGNFARRLADGDDLMWLLDTIGNRVDEVHYYDDGSWPSYADGGGSSLELRDPEADNSQAEAWAASDERDAAEWVSVIYEGRGRPVSGSNEPRNEWHELILGLLDAGEVLIDDVSLIEDPDGLAIERMQNGTFEQETDHWRLLGNHGQHGLSQVVADPDNPQNNVLHLVATGGTEHMHNHVETTLDDRARIQDSQTYQISFRAKWLAGSPQLNSRLYFNRLAETTILPITTRAGTPGEANSQRQDNIGPTFDNLRHEPAVPEPGQSVTVSVAATDADSITDIRLWYSVEGGTWQSVAMQPGADDRYAGTIPGQAFAQVVQFYVEGQDGQGATSQSPAAGPESRALYKVTDRAATTGPRHNFRVIMTDDDLDAMFTRIDFMSNLRMGATVIWNGQQVYYDVGLRLKGSGFSRGSNATGLNLRFPRQQLLFGEHDTVAVDRQGAIWGLGASQAELTIKHIANHAGDIPMMYDDVIQLIGPRDSLNGSAQLLLARYDDVFLESQFEDGGEGTRFKYELIYYSTLTDDGHAESPKLPPGSNRPGVFPVLGVDMPYMGDDVDAYRWNFLIRNQRAKDDFASIIAMTHAMRQSGSSVGGALDVQTRAVMDIDEWMRVFAFESLVGINDTYNQGLPHNLQLYVRPEDQRVLALPWDMDFSFDDRQLNMSIYGSGSRLGRVIRIPTNQRLFQQHLWNIMQTTYNEDYLRPWVEHLATMTEQNNTAAILNFVRGRRNFVGDRLMANIPFRITTNNGQPLEVDTPEVILEGEGWIDVREIRLAGATAPLSVLWLDDDRWQVTLPLQSASQQIDLEAYDLQGQLVGSGGIQVTTSAFNSVGELLRVTEVHYNPAPPTATEQAAGWSDNEDFEFVELTNIGSATVQLDGVRFVRDIPGGVSEGIGFSFTSGTRLTAGQSIVVSANPQAFRTRYGDIPVEDLPYDGQLSNGGEILTLVDAGGRLIQQFAYDDAWYRETDGAGHSLQIRSPQTLPPDAWDAAQAWMPSADVGGSPGHAALPDFNRDGQLNAQDVDQLCAAFGSNDPQFDLDHDGLVNRDDVDFLVKRILRTQPGDANLNGIFNSEDFVIVFQAGEYEDAVAGNSGWAEGDWDCDGDFTSSDMVLAFIEGGYVAAALPPRDGPIR